MKTRKCGFDFCAIYTKFALERTILPLFKSKGSKHSVDNLNFVYVNMAIPGYYIMIICLTALSHPVLEFFFEYVSSF